LLNGRAGWRRLRRRRKWDSEHAAIELTDEHSGDSDEEAQL
jgi:hypothetical protein